MTLALFTFRHFLVALFSSLTLTFAGAARAADGAAAVLPDAAALSVAQKLNGLEGFSFPDGQGFDRLGAAVAIAGNRALIGAPRDSNGVSEQGSVYAFQKLQGQWQFVQKLVGRDFDPAEGLFGTAVGISGETAVVGAYGAAFVFVIRDGAWIEETRLAPSRPEPYSGFGEAVSISGEVIVVGDSYGTCGGESLVGCAHVFRRFANGWHEDGRLAPSQPRAEMAFGASVAVNGDTILVGAPDFGFPPLDGSGAGSAYVYVRSSSVWIESQRLVRSDPTSFDGFGAAVSVVGDVAAIGAPSEGVGPGGEFLPGTVLVFRRNGNIWSETQQLLAGDQPFHGTFGRSLALQASRLVIGSGVERAYVFEPVGGLFAQQREIQPRTGERGRGLGLSVAISGDEVLTGVPDSQVQDNFHPGGAYIVNLAQSPEVATQRIDSGSPVLTEKFGSTTAVSGDLAVIGTNPSGGSGSGSSGSAYVYRRIGNVWIREAVLTSDQPGDGFGVTVAISRDQILVAAPSRNNDFGARAGSVFAYRRVAGIWQVHREIVAADAAPHSFFGMRLTASDDWLAVGSPWEDIGGVLRAGSVRVFERLADEWNHRAKLLAPDRAENDNFGDAIEISGADLAVGAPGTGGTPNEYRGSVYMYALQSDAWQLQSTLGPSTPMNVAFGRSVALDGSLLLVGAPVQARGAAYVFRRSGGLWPLERILMPSAGVDVTLFGNSVELDVPYAAIGARAVASFSFGTVELHLAEQDWGLIDRVRSPKVFGDDSFGGALAADGGVLLIGSQSESVDSVFGNPANGAAYSYDIGPDASTLFGDGFEAATP